MDNTLIQEVNQLHANICAALADPSRILILYLLSENDCSVNAIAEILDSPQPTISRHLKVLRERGLVLTEREGQSVIYSLADRRVIQALDLMRAILAHHISEQAALINQTQSK